VFDECTTDVVTASHVLSYVHHAIVNTNLERSLKDEQELQPEQMVQLEPVQQQVLEVLLPSLMVLLVLTKPEVLLELLVKDQHKHSSVKDC
jgi:hypothetical protein